MNCLLFSAFLSFLLSPSFHVDSFQHCNDVPSVTSVLSVSLWTLTRRSFHSWKHCHCMNCFSYCLSSFSIHHQHIVICGCVSIDHLFSVSSVHRLYRTHWQVILRYSHCPVTRHFCFFTFSLAWSSSDSSDRRRHHREHPVHSTSTEDHSSVMETFRSHCKCLWHVVHSLRSFRWRCHLYHLMTDWLSLTPLRHTYTGYTLVLW